MGPPLRDSAEREREFRFELGGGGGSNGRLNPFTFERRAVGFFSWKHERTVKTFHPNFILTMYGCSAERAGGGWLDMLRKVLGTH